jgi:hypothetical protein
VVIYTELSELRDRDGNVLGDEALHRELANAKSTDPQRLVDVLAELAARHARGLETPHSWTTAALALAAEVRS